MPTCGNMLNRQEEEGTFETARNVPMGFTDWRNETAFVDATARAMSEYEQRKAWLAPHGIKEEGI